MIKILVLVEDYPSPENKYPMAYVHSRLKEYSKNKNLELTVLSFRSPGEYLYEGIRVISRSMVERDAEKHYDRFVSHAPNIKNHVIFILRNSLKNVVFFIHGHEVLSIRDYYPPDYVWVRNRMKGLVRRIYDPLKLLALRHFFTHGLRFRFVFVSKWMSDEAHRSLKLRKELPSSTIYNPISEFYAFWNFDGETEKKYDFITVRPLDGSKYCIDIVVQLANANPRLRFKIIGRGDFFKHVPLPKNVTWINNFFSPPELAGHLNEARIALMPTRLDAQGVMMCELAASGMPVVTSSISIAKEVLSGYSGAYFLDNNNPEDSFARLLSGGLLNSKAHDSETIRQRFSSAELTDREISVIGACE